LYRYIEELEIEDYADEDELQDNMVGLCRLNHVDPCHITYSLSNP
jgi:hypothetical protein